MNPEVLRMWGVAFGGAALAGAIGIAVVLGDPAAPSAPEKTIATPLIGQAGPPSDAPAPPAPSPQAEPEAGAEPAPVAEIAEAQFARPAFLVRFAPEHPLARAQALAAQGREAEARALARELAPRSRELRGLCFDRFTLGGAELVFSACAPLAEPEAAAFRRNWARRFQEMAGVAYAEPNLIADVEAGAPH